MRVRGFPERWVTWIARLLQTAQSTVQINRERTEYIQHRRGLRQGDPISPMLFIMAVDVLQKLIMAVNSLLQHPLSHKIGESILALQYADDTTIVDNAHQETLIFLKLTLRIFAKVSGLRINFSKSCFVPFNLTDEKIDITTAVLGFEKTSLPITYLEMPLTIRTPDRQSFLPIIEKLEKKLEGWKSKMISHGGRLQLVRSVLSSIPIYFMTSFMLPKWVLNRIDHIRRSFIWGKSGQNTRGISLINWESVCMPLEWGGMGIQDLRLHNMALILRWWWRAYSTQTSLWNSTIMMIKRTRDDNRGPIFWVISGSFFWTNLRALLLMFHWCITWKVGDDRNTSY